MGFGNSHDQSLQSLEIYTLVTWLHYNLFYQISSVCNLCKHFQAPFFKYSTIVLFAVVHKDFLTNVKV